MDKLEGLRGRVGLLEKAVVDWADASEVEEQLKALRAELDKLEQEQQPKPWPQVWDEYWFIDDLGDKENEEWDGNEFDHYRLATGNCHRTEAEALAYREWQTDPRVVARGMIERMEGFDPRGEYVILVVNNTLSIGQSGYADGAIRFSKEWNAECTVDAFPQLLMVALGVITDKEEAGRIVRLAIGKVQSVNGQEAMGK